MTTLEKIESLMIPEEKAREIATGVGDTIIQVVVKSDESGTCKRISMYGSTEGMMIGIHTALDAMSERFGIPVSELAKMILDVAEMEESNEQEQETD